jgi:phage-related baseplate assembly protein
MANSTFRLQSAASLTAAAIADMQALSAGLTDFTEGAVGRSMIESIMIRIAELYQSTYAGVRQGVLTGTYRNFSFAKLPASYATGTLTFTLSGAATSPQAVPQGTIVQIPNTSLQYATTQAETIQAGASSVTIPAIALTVGSAGNTASNTITQLVSALPFAVTVTNQSPWLNGTDQESDQGRFQRFQAFIAGLSQGTSAAIQAAALQTILTDNNGNITERVQNVVVVEPFKTGGLLGYIEVWIDNGGGTASNALITATANALLGYVDSNGASHPGVIADGIRLDVFAITPFQLNVTGLITLAAGYDPTATSAAAVSAIAGYIGSLNIGAQFIISQAEAAALSVAGVTDIQLVSPLANVSPAQGQRITAGTISLTVVGGPLTT